MGVTGGSGEEPEAGAAVFCSMTDHDVEAVVLRVDGEIGKVIDFLGLRNVRFVYVPNAAKGRPVRRYRCGNRSLFLETANDEVVLRAYFSLPTATPEKVPDNDMAPDTDGGPR